MTTVDYRMTCPIVTHLHNGETCTRCCGGHEYWAVLKNCRQNVAESLTVSLYNAMTRKLGLFHRHISRFIAPSEFTRKWLIEHAAIHSERITTNSPVVEMPESATDAASGGYVAFAGRFAPEKGVETLLNAAERCGLPFRLSRNEHSRVTVDISSNGGDIDTVVTRNRDELHAFYRGARMLVLPSVWFETFALVGAEAMSHGVPVVASRFGAMECLIEDGVDGLLFRPGDAGDLAAKVKQLWADPALCRRLGEAARRKALKLWAPERHVERLNKLYAEVCCAAQAESREIEPAAAPCEEAFG
jgi:glycosyltransferase involved in cell wall biosynthesis